jgi:hypothetical protein
MAEHPAKEPTTREEFFTQLERARANTLKMKAKRPEKIDVLDEIDIQLAYIARSSREPGGPSKSDKDHIQLLGLTRFNFPMLPDGTNGDVETVTWSKQVRNVAWYFKNWKAEAGEAK